MLPFVDAFAASDASVGLVLGGAVTLVFTFIYYMMRDVLSFEEFAKCIPEGFQSMIAPDSDPYDGVDVIRHDKPARCKIFLWQILWQILHLRCRDFFR